MEKLVLLYFLVFFIYLLQGVTTTKTQDKSEDWGYVEVRPQAHLFWWLYRSPYRVENPSKPWPIILWLQGGPGASGIGIGNFQEVGPLDATLQPRNSTWLKLADLLFVDNPVGTGYSYVEDTENKTLFVKTDEEAAIDLTTLLENLFNKNNLLQKSPLYIVAESYGGKFAVTLGLSALKSIQSGKLMAKLGGVVLGDSWISAEDFVESWGPLLKDVSRIDDNGLQRANKIVEVIKKQISDGQYETATNSWSELEGEISSSSNSVDFYNFLLDAESDPLSIMTSARGIKRYMNYLSLSSNLNSNGGIDSLMNGPIRDKLKIIPPNILWGGQSGYVFDNLQGDFMRPRISEVDELLAKGVNVTVYNGQLDLICATKGTEAWIHKLKWEGLGKFLNTERSPLYCGGDKITRGFTKSYKNLHFYWILQAGHFVTVDQPCIALKMVGAITQSPATTLSSILFSA